MNKQELINFEEDIKNLFLNAKIKAPIHLSRGNEDALINIFKEIKPKDWVFSTHRNHYHALLHGIDKDWLRSQILVGRSMHINNQKHRFMTSSMVSGCLPIAIGVAMAIKRKRLKRHVWCLVGDMAAETGAFYECTKYAKNFNLPINFVIEDNQFSTNTPTNRVWGIKKNPLNRGEIIVLEHWGKGEILYYFYQRGFPHINVGKFVIFK